MTTRNGVGVATRETLRGDLHHLISPVIGALRLEDAGDSGPHAGLVDRLRHALELADEHLEAE